MAFRDSCVRAAYAAAGAVRLNGLIARCTGRSLRILAYHGVCPDDVRSEPWVPPYFVSESEFDRQMAYIRSRYRPVHLREALLHASRDGAFEPGSIAVTFDDGYANNLTLALPALRRHNVPATVFAATRWVEEQDLLPHDKIRLIRLWSHGAESFSSFKTQPVGCTLQRLSECWPRYSHMLTGVQRSTLIPMTWSQAAAAAPLVEFGAHTHQHAILRNEPEAAREWEIVTSLSAVRKNTGRADPLFAYPNGEAGDFSAADKHVLQINGCPAAVSAIAGWNRFGDDIYELKRLPVTLGHSPAPFGAEVAGLRTLVGRLR